GHVAGREHLEEPDAGRDAHDAPLALPIRGRRKRALAGERAGGGSEERLGSHVRVRDPLAALADDASLQTADRLLRVRCPAGQVGQGEHAEDAEAEPQTPIVFLFHALLRCLSPRAPPAFPVPPVLPDPPGRPARQYVPRITLCALFSSLIAAAR